MDDDFAELRALAEKATPGPWVRWAGTHLVIRLFDHTKRPGQDLRICEAAYNSWNDESRYNTDYIAACSPDVVLRLLDAAEDYEEDLLAYRASNDALRARTARLERALRKIAEHEQCDEYRYCMNMGDIARAALADEREEPK